MTKDIYLRAVMDTVLDGIIVIDEKGRIESSNVAAERLFGYSAVEIAGQNVSILMPEPFSGEHDSYLRNYLKTGKAHIIGIGREVLGKRKDGSEFPIELAVSEMKQDGQRFFVGAIRDITQQKMTLEKLRLHGAALEAAANAVLITDLNGNITWINKSFTTLTGYQPEEVIGKSPRLLKSEQQDAVFYKTLWENVTAGKVWHGEIVNRRKDGSLYTEEQTITPVRNEQGGISHFIAIKQDVTARKEAERALDEKNREIAESARVDRTHGEVMSLFSGGYDLKAILSQTLALIANAHGYLMSAVYLYDEWSGTLRCATSYGIPVDLQREYLPGEGLVGQAAADRQTLILEIPQDMPWQMETGLFTIIPRAVVAVPILYQDKVLGVLSMAFTSHFSARDRAFVERMASLIGVGLNNINQYQDLKALSDQLKQRGHEIARKNQQLEDSNRLKSEFLANMSHELRTPLNAIIGFSEVLKDGLLGDLAEEQQDYVKDIFDSGNHLLSLINDILDLSKIEAGKMDLDLQDVQIQETLSNSLSIIKEKALSHSINLTLDVSPNVGEIIADPRKFKQVVYNLLSNAVKFTPPGGKIKLEARREGDWLLVSVTDTGIGISAENVSRLFRAFEQLDGSLSRKYEGTGLGLVMVKRLVELHGGTVNVESEPDKGSCFQFRLPYRNESANIPASAPYIPSVSKQVTFTEENADHSPLVMVVEENDSAADLMTKQLHLAGYRIQHVRNGADALAAMEVNRPNLIVLDVQANDAGGWNLFNELRQAGANDEIPVVLVSMSEASSSKGITLGSVDLMEKPVRKEMLLQVLERYAPMREQNGIPRVLVVDDDHSAVEFVSANLESKGYAVLRAFNGKDAIELAIRELPDLIILDLMMPEITGFDVVATLRDNSETEAIPIVILTAKVLSEEDRQLLTGRVANVLEKRTFDTSQFLSEVRINLGTKHSVSTNIKPLVLVVEDNPEQSELLKLYLEDVGYRVTQAMGVRAWMH
jgi:PAS domain S-box-containing protein